MNWIFFSNNELDRKGWNNCVMYRSDDKNDIILDYV